LDFKAQDLAGFAFGHKFNGSTAYFAVGGEALGPDGCIDGDIESLATKWALNRFGNFHGINLSINPVFDRFAGLD